MDPGTWPILWTVAAFIAAGAAIVIAGVRLVPLADRLADRTGMGEALLGGIILGASTSLSGTVTSITAAYGGHASLAFSNAVGGIAVQTVFLAIADFFYRRANLEHAAASAENLFQSALLVFLLALPLGAALSPDIAVFAIHPITPVLFGVYLFGVRLAGHMRDDPMWFPRRTNETREDIPEEENADAPSTTRLVIGFVGLVAVLGLAGWVIAKTGLRISEVTGLSQSLVGAILTSTTTSLPELVTTVAAVRRGALTLAVGGIVGGNTFDVLFLVGSDIAYRDGSLYHAVGERELFLIIWSIAMAALLLMGLLRRERRGAAGIGFESTGLIALYAGGLALQVWLR